MGELLGKKEWNGKSRAGHTVKCIKKKNNNNCKYKIKSVCVLLLIEKKVECKKKASNRIGNKKKKVDLWMNGPLESKLLHPRKTMNCL